MQLPSTLAASNSAGHRVLHTITGCLEHRRAFLPFNNRLQGAVESYWASGPSQTELWNLLCSVYRDPDMENWLEQKLCVYA